MQDIFTHLTNDRFFSTLSKFDQGNINKASLINKFKDHDWFKGKYEASCERTYLKVRYHVSNK